MINTSKSEKTIRELSRSLSRGGAIYHGTVHAYSECATGRLCFFGDKGHMPDGACILVAEDPSTAADMLSGADSACTVAAIVLGETVPDDALREAQRLAVPLLCLSSLSRRHSGKIAILDADSASLFVDPDVETLARYASAFGTDGLDLPSLYSGRFSHVCVTKTNSGALNICGALHLCSAGRDGIIRTEDELFDDYRDMVEAVRPLTLTCLLSPAYPFDHESGERLSAHARALFRAAVYGEVRILCCGPCTLTLSGAERVMERLRAEAVDMCSVGRECNASVPIGILVSSPLLLDALPRLTETVRTDSICINADRISRALIGVSEHSRLPSGAYRETWELIRARLTQSRAPHRTVLLSEGAVRCRDPFSDETDACGIKEIFIKK